MPPSSGRSPRSQLPSRIEDIENKVVRAMLGPKRQEDARYTTEGFVTCTCHQLFITVIKSKKGNSWGCNTHGEARNAYKTALRKAEGKSQLGLPMHKWNDNIKTYFEEIGCEDMWTGFIRLMMGPNGGFCEHNIL
jgi:hypothetical protein